jgi:periplasmic protein TonB
MPFLRPLTWLASLALHAGLLLAIVGVSAGGAAFDTGSSGDMFVVEQGIALQGVAKFGEAEERIETVDIPPVRPVEQPKEVKEVEPDLNNVVTSTEAQHEEQVVKEDPKPIEDKPVQPVPVQEQAPQVATLLEQSSGQAQQGGDTTQRRAYLGTLSKSIERAKVNPRSRQAGTVMVRFTVGPDGNLISRAIEKSSGSKVLDEAAVAALDRAAPFPPMPQTVAQGPIDVSVPFEFVTR